MPTTHTPLTPRETYLKFVAALADGKWGDAQDCVARKFRGTPTGAPQGVKFGFADYLAEMKRLKAALDHFGQLCNLRITERGGVLTVQYTLDMVFVRDLQPSAGSRSTSPLKANRKPVVIDVVDTVVFSSIGEIIDLASATDQTKWMDQMLA